MTREGEQLLQISTLLSGGASVRPRASLTLPFAGRQKTRQRVRLDDQRLARLQLGRGTVLRDGDLLRADDGTLIEVRAAAEELSVIRVGDARELARAAYHLGNRHVPVQLERGGLSYARDHVLDHMLERFGLVVVHELRAFEPEPGAYNGHPHADGTHHSDGHHADGPHHEPQ